MTEQSQRPNSTAGATVSAAPARLASIDLGVFQSNLYRLAERSSEPIPVALDLDAYGHGAAAIARVARDSGLPIRFRGEAATAAMAASWGITLEVRRAVEPDTSDAELACLGLGGFSLQTPGLVPVLTLSVPLAHAKRVAAGHGVSYGYSYRTADQTTLALMPLGYADGLPRSASNRGRVAVCGTRYPIIGRIAMDQCVLDVGDAAVTEGQTATVFGSGAAGEARADDWAEWAGITVGELVSRLGPRVKRQYLGAP